MNTLKKYPLFIFLLPLFFVLHGFTENYDFVPPKDAVMLTGVYLAFSIIFLLLFRLFFKNWLKAALLAFCIMSFHFFFGSIHDGLKNIFPGAWVTKYSFILPFSFCLLVLMFVLLKRRKKPLLKFSYYLSSLLLLLLFIDMALLVNKIIRKKNISSLSKEFFACPDCKKPNIYLIIADEYAGYEALKDIFLFDNSTFENELSKRGFHVVKKARSNYNFTPFSMASLLSMDYLKGISNKSNDGENRSICYQNINNNDLVNYLNNLGYSFVNQSIFDFAGKQAANSYNDFHLTGKRLVTSQTFTERLNKDLSYHLITTFKFNWAKKRIQDLLKSDIQNKYNNTITIANERSDKPRFIYTHFFMPHYPYLFDKDGKEITFEQSQESGRKDLYLGFLQYCNKLYLSLIDTILKTDQTKPIILLMSDHGFTKYGPDFDRSYIFQNIINIYFPDQDYSQVPDSLSNVNVFRLLLNTQFRRQLPFLKDSTIYLQEY